MESHSVLTTSFVRILEQLLLVLLDRQKQRDLLMLRDLPQPSSALLNVFYEFYGISLCFVFNNKKGLMAGDIRTDYFQKKKRR